MLSYEVTQYLELSEHKKPSIFAAWKDCSVPRFGQDSSQHQESPPGVEAQAQRCAIIKPFAGTCTQGAASQIAGAEMLVHGNVCVIGVWGEPAFFYGL